MIAALGLHPELACERHAEIELLEQAMPQTRFVGEIGLDGTPPHRKAWDLQMSVFTRALTAAEQLGGRVVTIHSRRAAADVLKVLGECTTPERVLPILHWFSDSIRHTEDAVRMGCYFSINLPMLTSELGNALVESLPADRILTESDAPFTGVTESGRHSQSIGETVRRLAQTRGITEAEMRIVLSTNAKRVLAFGGLETT